MKTLSENQKMGNDDYISGDEGNDWLYLAL